MPTWDASTTDGNSDPSAAALMPLAAGCNSASIDGSGDNWGKFASTSYRHGVQGWGRRPWLVLAVAGAGRGCRRPVLLRARAGLCPHLTTAARAAYRTMGDSAVKPLKVFSQTATWFPVLASRKALAELRECRNTAGRHPSMGTGPGRCGWTTRTPHSPEQGAAGLAAMPARVSPHHQRPAELCDPPPSICTPRQV